jgi:predicted TIM-barrel fold metal-dependent hydrolase
MDRDGVDATVMYGQTTAFATDDAGLRPLVYAAYNDWVWDFCRQNPARLVGVAQLPAEDAAAAIQELGRAVRIGFRHVNVMAAIAEIPVYDHQWERFWALAEETGVSVAFHLGGGPAPQGPLVPESVRSALRVIEVPQQLAGPISGVILTGVLDRYPNVKLVMAESGIGWVPFMIQCLDASYQAMRANRWPGRETTIAKLTPSEYFERQIWMTFQDDPAGTAMLGKLPVNRVMWASDYPHPQSTWPHSQHVIAAQTRELAPYVRRRVLCDNARELYSL